MKKKWTRRRFLKTGLTGSMAAGAGVVAGIAPASARGSLRPVARKKYEGMPAGFAPQEREGLRAAMDEIIPAGEGMPAASEVGGVEYLEQLVRREPEIAKGLRGSLSAVEDVSQKRFKKPFTALSRAQRVQSLTELEKQTSKAFATLRDYVYEAYYTQPRVWKLIGYEFYPTDQRGPQMKPFDEVVLAKVRRMPKLYRETT